jgi:hypothetical protein
MKTRGIALILALAAGEVFAGARIDLRPVPPVPTEGYAPHSVIRVYAYLVDTGNPQRDVAFRSVFLDFNDSDASFTYPDCNFIWYNPFAPNNCPDCCLPFASWVYPLPMPNPPFQITMPNDGEVLLGYIDVDVGVEGGVLDAMNRDEPDPNFGARVDFGFGGPGDPLISWSAFNGGLTGGSLDIVVNDGTVRRIVGSMPAHNAVDARQPTDPHGESAYGWDFVDLTFDGEVPAVTAQDFYTYTQIDNTVGVGPAVVEVEHLAGDRVRVHLGEMLEPGSWTTIQHVPSNTSVRLGYLPGAVGNDLIVGPDDILVLIDVLNGVANRPMWATDVDRSGVTNAADILRLIDLLNGAGAFDVWNGEELP